MLNNVTKSFTMSATSVIPDDNIQNQNVVMYMNANINSDGVNINQSIRNKELYSSNKDSVDADYEEFKQKVMEYIK